MAEDPTKNSDPHSLTVADIMQPPVTTIEQNDHVAGAAYLMKRSNATALVVNQAHTGQPVGIITEADISHLVADGKNPNDVRIYQLMTARPTVVNTTTSIYDAARLMTSRRFRHLPVTDDTGLVGIVDITDVCRALLEAVEEVPSDGLQGDQQEIDRKAGSHERATIAAENDQWAEVLKLEPVVERVTEPMCPVKERQDENAE
jgi:CBS domain-containing protein